MFFLEGLSRGLLLSGNKKFVVGNSYLMTCDFTGYSKNDTYITVNKTRFTKENGTIEFLPNILTIRITDIGLVYNATIFQCHAGGDEGNNLTIHGEYISSM